MPLGQLPPGARGYVLGEQLEQQKQAQQVGQLAQFLQMQGILAQQQEAERKIAQEKQFRQELGGLGPEATQESLARVAAKYAGPQDILRTQQSSLDRRAQIDATGELRRATLSQQAANVQMQHEFRMRSARTDEERALETARHNKVIEGIQGELAELKKKAAGLGKAIPLPLQKQLTEAAEIADATQRFSSTFKDEFAGDPLTGELRNTYGRYFGDTSGRSQWWQDYELHQSQVRNKLFGSALTAPEIEAWNKSAINSKMDPGQVGANLKRRNEIEQKGLDRLIKGATAGGYNKEQIEAFTGRSPSGGGTRLRFDAQGNPLP